MAEVHAVERADRDGPRAGSRSSAGARATFIVERCERLVGGDDPLRVRICHVEGPDVRAPQAHAVPAERLGDGPDVAARAETHRQPRNRRLVPHELELVDARPAHGHLHGDASAVELVRALTADLHRRRGGNLQVDLAAERLEALEELGFGRGIVLLDDLTLGVPGRSHPGQVDRSLVPLRNANEALRLLRERAEQDEQEAGRKRVECPGVAGPRARLLPDVADDREGRRACGLVEEDEPAGSRRAFTRHLATRRTRVG